MISDAESDNKRHRARGRDQDRSCIEEEESSDGSDVNPNQGGRVINDPFQSPMVNTGEHSLPKKKRKRRKRRSKSNPETGNDIPSVPSIVIGNSRSNSGERGSDSASLRGAQEKPEDGASDSGKTSGTGGKKGKRG